MMGGSGAHGAALSTTCLLQCPTARCKPLLRLHACHPCALPPSMYRPLWRHVIGVPWCPAMHAAMPPAFKAAVRTLLLAAHGGAQRGAAPAGSATAGARTRRAAARQQAAHAVALLGALPRDVLLSIVRLAATPLTAWLPDE